MRIHGLETKTTPFAKGLTVVRFATALDTAAQERARQVLVAAGGLHPRSSTEAPLEPSSCFVAGTFDPPGSIEDVVAIRGALNALATELGAMAAWFVQVGAELDPEGETNAWRGEAPPRETAPAFSLERYPEILEQFDREDFGIALKLGGAPVPGESTLFRALHAFWLAPYVAGETAPRHYGRSGVVVDDAHRSALLWVDDLAAPATPDALVHHLVWVVARLHDIVPVLSARFDHATPAMKDDGGEHLVLAGNPLLARYAADGAPAMFAWADGQTTFDATELAAMFVEVGRTLPVRTKRGASLAMRVFERALALAPRSDDAAKGILGVLVVQGRIEDAVVRATKWGDPSRKKYVLRLVAELEPARLTRAVALLARDVLVDADGPSIGALVAAAAAHAPAVLDALLDVVPPRPEVAAHVEQASEAAKDPEVRQQIKRRVSSMPPPPPPESGARLGRLQDAYVGPPSS